MRRRATAGGYVCIWTLREKKWPILTVIFCFFNFFLFLTRPHQCPLCPPPSQPHWGSGSTVKDAFRAPEWWWTGAFSHPRVKYQLWLLALAHCAYLLAYTHINTAGLTWTIQSSKKKKEKYNISSMHSKSSHWMYAFEPETRLNVVHRWKKEMQRAAELDLLGCEELCFFCGAALIVARSLRLDASPDYTCCGQLY